MKLSVLYVTNRPGGFDVLVGNLKRQTHKDFELVVVDGLAEVRQGDVEVYLADTIEQPFIYVPDPGPTNGAATSLESAYNRGLARCSGARVVFLQDYVWVGHLGLERFANAPEGFVSGCGNVGEASGKVSDGTITVFEKPYFGEPGKTVWADPRLARYYALSPAESYDEWEMSWACAPLSALEDLGGFDEDYETAWGWGNVDMAHRAMISNYEIWVDPANLCRAWYHDTWWPNRLKQMRQLNAGMFREKAAARERGDLSPALDYLAKYRQELVRYGDGTGIIVGHTRVGPPGQRPESDRVRGLG